LLIAIKFGPLAQNVFIIKLVLVAQVADCSYGLYQNVLADSRLLGVGIGCDIS
jgi:hypothetical protein